MEREEIPEIERLSPQLDIKYSDVLGTEWREVLTYDNTIIMLFGDQYEDVSYILINKDDGQRIPLFNQGALMSALTEREYPTFYRLYPDDEDLGWYLEYQANCLQRELDELD